MAIGYTPTTWVNGRDGGQTPLNATNMNNIEAGVSAACDALDALGDPLAVAHGGTGAATAEAARAALGVGVLLWSGSQTGAGRITVPGVSAYAILGFATARSGSDVMLAMVSGGAVKARWADGVSNLDGAACYQIYELDAAVGTDALDITRMHYDRAWASWGGSVQFLAGDNETLVRVYGIA